MFMFSRLNGSTLASVSRLLVQLRAITSAAFSVPYALHLAHHQGAVRKKGLIPHDGI